MLYHPFRGYTRTSANQKVVSAHRFVRMKQTAVLSIPSWSMEQAEGDWTGIRCVCFSCKRGWAWPICIVVRWSIYCPSRSTTTPVYRHLIAVSIITEHQKKQHPPSTNHLPCRQISPAPFACSGRLRIDPEKLVIACRPLGRRWHTHRNNVYFGRLGYRAVAG